jgi:hypothetical protein
VEALLWIVGSVVATAVVGVLQSRAARRRRVAAEAGRSVTLTAWLRIGDGRQRRGRLTLSPATQLVWRPLFGGRLVDLGGSALLATALADGNTAQLGDVVLNLAVPGIGPAQLQLPGDDAGTVVRSMQDLPVPPAPAARAERPRRTWWAVLCVILAAAWAGIFVIGALAGYTATATVTGGDGEGFCTVTWDEGPGHAGSGEVDCPDETVGSKLTVRIFMWPDENDPWDTASAVFAVLMISGPLALVGGWRLRYVRNRRPAVLADAAPARLSLQERLDDESWQRPGESLAAFLARLAPFARRQVPADGWERSGRPAGATTVLSLRRLGTAMAGPALIVTCTLAATAGPCYRWVVLASGATETTVAAGTGDTPIEGWGPLPPEVTVRFEDAAGGEHLAEVVSGHELTEGQAVRIEYSVDHPGQARLIDGGVADGNLLVCAVALGLALIWAAVNTARLVRRARAVRRSLAAPERQALGLLTADWVGKPLVLVCDPLVVPVRFTAVELLEPLPHGTAASFAVDGPTSLTIRGGPPGDLPVVQLMGGPPLLPAVRAFQPDAERVIDLLDTVGALMRETATSERPAPTA